MARRFSMGGSDDGRFVTLSGQTLVSSEGQYGSSTDLFDIALHRFSPDAVARLAKKRFLIFDDIEFDSQSATAVYTIFGFPAVWSSPGGSTDNKVDVQGGFRAPPEPELKRPWPTKVASMLCAAPSPGAKRDDVLSIRPYEGNPPRQQPSGRRNGRLHPIPSVPKALPVT